MNLSFRNITRVEFDKYFDNRDFKQWKLGNCYFVASLRSLMVNNNYKKLITSSVKMLTQDGKIKRFVVKMPLWEPNWESVYIEADDINQKQYVIRDWKRVERSGISQWSLWVKVLEAAYNEYVMWEDNWTLVNMEWWYGSLAILNLLWRENVKIFNYRIPKLNILNPKKNQSKAAFQEYKPEFDNIEFESVKQFLLWFNPNEQIVTLSSKSWETDEKTYLIWWKEFYYRHAYSLVWVKKNWNDIESIDVINPHDTSKTISLSYLEFISTFSRISGAKLTNNFMDNKTESNTNTVFDHTNRR
jgi:hypothetical protein